MPERYRIVPLSDQDRTAFTCGIEVLDRYLREQASQDIRRRVSNCFVAVDAAGEIVAYYSFAAANILTGEIPTELRRKLPRYRYLPAALIGRLAVGREHQRQGLGETLVADAAVRAAQSAPAVFALLVDAKDANAEAFYRRLGFVPLLGKPMRLFLPVATANKARATD